MRLLRRLIYCTILMCSQLTICQASDADEFKEKKIKAVTDYIEEFGRLKLCEIQSEGKIRSQHAAYSTPSQGHGILRVKGVRMYSDIAFAQSTRESVKPLTIAVNPSQESFSESSVALEAASSEKIVPEPSVSSSTPKEPQPFLELKDEPIVSPSAPQPVKIIPKIEDITSQGGTLEVAGLKITIPQDAVKDKTRFSIKLAPADIQLPEGTKPLTALYEVEPHNMRFRDLIDLDFTLSEPADDIALFIRKDTEHDHEFKKWLVIEPSQLDNNIARFAIRSFSFLFVGQLDMQKDVSLTNVGSPNTQNNTVRHNIILPGLNYRAYCENPDCSLGKDPKKLMVINRGFGEKISVQEDMDEQRLKCLKCNTPIEDEENIKQIVLFQTDGEMRYTKDVKGAKPVQIPLNVMDNRLSIYGDVDGHSEKYKSVFFKISPSRTNFRPQAGATIEYDKDGNPIGNIFDLCADGGAKNIKLLIGKFYNGDGFTYDSFKNHVGKALDEKGFKWHCTEDEDEFLRELSKYDIAWVISFHSSKMKYHYFPDYVINFHKSGKGLMLWEDNDSVPGRHTTATLQKLFGFSVEGNDPGWQKMTAAADCTQKCTFDKSHPILQGINCLYEGVTISHPNVPLLPTSVKALATSSADRPNIMYVDADKGAGRVIIDCGFTKLFQELWDTAGTARYVKNATFWLYGLPYDDTL